MRRGVVCIGTGTYSSFIPVLEGNLADAGAADVVFALTDDAELLAQPRDRRPELEILRLPWGRLPWPLPTLFRYHAMRAYAPVFRQEATHLVYCDVDMRIVGPVDDLYRDRLFAVQHPGGVQGGEDWPPPFERNPRSRAYVAHETEGVYVAGGVQGGPVNDYLAAVDELADGVSADHLAGVMARWHDESHWNSWVLRSHEVQVLGAEYCWPESWAIPPGLGAPRILALDKDHHVLRGTRPVRTAAWKDRLVKVPLARRTVRAARSLRR